MRFLKLGATALAGVFLVAGAMTPVALAQQPPIAQVSKAMAGPVNEANAAIAAKDWATAKTKLVAAYAAAKTPNEKLAVEQLRVSVAANASDWTSLIAAINAIEAINLLPAADMKTYRGVMSEAYKKLGDTPNALKAQKAYLDQYGTHQELAVFAQDSANAGDHATAVAYIDKAIASGKAAGAKAPESYYRIKLRATQGSGDAAALDKAFGEILTEYPKEDYWKQMIARVQTMPGFSAEQKLDMFRALVAAGVKLAPNEKRSYATEALKRGMPNETVQTLEPAFAAGELGSTPEDQKAMSDAKTAVAGDKTGLAKETADALAKGSSSTIAKIGEAHLSYGDNAKAIEVLQKALDKGIANAGEAELAKLHLGIAQLRAGQKDAAKATLGGITAGVPGALAHSWMLISDLK